MSSSYDTLSTNTSYDFQNSDGSTLHIDTDAHGRIKASTLSVENTPFTLDSIPLPVRFGCEHSWAYLRQVEQLDVFYCQHCLVYRRVPCNNYEGIEDASNDNPSGDIIRDYSLLSKLD